MNESTEARPRSPDDEVRQVVREVEAKARVLEQDAEILRFRHQFYTVSTILLGVVAPAMVSYTPSVGFEWQWKMLSIFATALATGAATIRTVLRFSERYSNASLTAIALLGLKNQLQSKKEEILATVKVEFLSQKLYEVASWGRAQMFEVVKAFVEKDVSAITQDKISMIPPPEVQQGQLRDETRR